MRTVLTGGRDEFFDSASACGIVSARVAASDFVNVIYVHVRATPLPTSTPASMPPPMSTPFSVANVHAVFAADAIDLVSASACDYAGAAADAVVTVSADALDNAFVNVTFQGEDRMQQLKVNLAFSTPGYIANPYWPEMYRVIEIEKVSGMNRCRSDKKKREALENHLRELKLTLDDYDTLRLAAQRPFHLNGNGASIIIPSANFAACMSNANQVAPSKFRIDNLMAALTFSNLTTGKSGPDGKWERFVVPKDGTGKVLSNQRGFRSSPYIENFTAEGGIGHDETQVRPQDIIELLTYAGRNVGIGASRKMGWGRFVVET